MLKLLIADDELIIRQGMRRMISWESMGIILAGEAETFSETLEKIRQLRPDIVLCDIRMPGGTGLDVIHEVKQSMPEIEFILLSGYSDRDYMLDAIHNNVCDYLLKPATSEDITKAVMKASKKILERRNEEIRRLEHHHIVSENLDVLRNHFIEDLLCGSLSFDSFEEHLRLYQIDLVGPNYLVMLAQFHEGKAYPLLQDFAFLFGKYKPIVVLLPSLENSAAVILNLETDLSHNWLLPFHRDFMRHSENLSSAILVSNICNTPQDLAACFSPLKDFMKKSIWFQTGDFVLPESQVVSEYDEQTVLHLCNEIFDAAKSHSEAAILACKFDDFLSYMKSVKPDHFLFYDVVNNIFHTLCYFLGMPRIFSVQEYSPDELRERFLELYRYSELPSNKYSPGVVGKAIQYLEKNYDSAISLESVAAELYISPSYLSRIVKEKTGRKFQDWIHYFRMEKAISLLKETQETTNRIAELCGYNSYKLFSEHFKRYTGMTASEYRGTDKSS